MREFKVSIIIPVYNEEGCIKLLVEELIKVLCKFHDYEIIFIDDGSKDRSLSIIKELKSENNKIHFISFSRNFGHQNAIKAGIDNANGDCIISMDADLQHPPALIPTLIKKWIDGYDIVYTLRTDSDKTSFFKKATAKIFYKLISTISDIKIESGAADFRLIDKKVAQKLKELNEYNIFFRGIINWIGFKQISINYKAENRKWGKTKYSIKKMFSLALVGITSFSTKPLRISFFMGIITAFLSLIYGIYALCIKVFTDSTIEGWTSVFFMVTFIGAIQLIMIGILGEYLGKLFIESKKRPNYIVNENSLITEEKNHSLQL